LIDSHHHLWSYSPAEYDWIPPRSPLAQDQLLEQLNATTAAAGVDGTVVVQARQTLEQPD
jgi:L-fuconolactonase